MAMHAKDRILNTMDWTSWARAELKRLELRPDLNSQIDNAWQKQLKQSLASADAYLRTFGWTWTGNRYELTG